MSDYDVVVIKRMKDPKSQEQASSLLAQVNAITNIAELPEF